MERHKTTQTQQMRFGANPRRFCFTRRIRASGRRGIGDLRVSKGQGKNGAATRIDMRLRSDAAKRCGLEAGDPIILSADLLDGETLFCVRKVSADEGMLLSRNSRAGNNDLRASFTVDENETAALFGESGVFICDLSQDHGEQQAGQSVFVCVREE